MSQFSGKCDLADHINGLAGWYNKDGKPVKLGEANVLYGDEYRDFEKFKQQTGGVLYQHKAVILTKWNQDLVAAKNPSLAITTKGKHKIYTYCDKQFRSIKQVNRYIIKRNKKFAKGWGNLEFNRWRVPYMYITVEIHFDTLLDLLPYYPYIIGSACCNGDKSTVFISDKSFVDEHDERLLQGGYESGVITDHYKKELQNHYRDIVLRYFNPEGREVEELVDFNENHQAKTKYQMDPNFDVEWVFDEERKSCWTSPKKVDDHTVEISQQDYEQYIGHAAKIKYVKAKEYPVYLG